MSVKNISGFVTFDRDGSWVCQGNDKHKEERLPDPVSLNSRFLCTATSITLVLVCQ